MGILMHNDSSSEPCVPPILCSSTCSSRVVLLAAGCGSASVVDTLDWLAGWDDWGECGVRWWCCLVEGTECMAFTKRSAGLRDMGRWRMRCWWCWFALLDSVTVTDSCLGRPDIGVGRAADLE